MPFTDKTRWEVKRRAHFKCCWCQQLKGSLDAHHIIPESEGGTNDIDNAAPLCKECHDTYGSNPSKRTEIRKRRDFWYEKCETILKHESIEQLEETFKIIQKTYVEYEERLENVENNVKTLQQKNNYWFDINQKLISELSDASDEKKSKIFQQIASTSNIIASGTATIAEVSGNVNVIADYFCPKCGSPTINRTGTNRECVRCKFVW